MGIKRSLETVSTRITSRMRRIGILRSFSSPSTVTSFRDRGIEWLYLIILFLLAAGVANAAANASAPGINGLTIAPTPTAQSVTETFILLFTYIIGALGGYAMYLSGRQTIRARSSEMFFVGGIILFSIALTIGYFVVSVK
ncbi:MAG: hypothetical protein ACRECH_15850 [Nitrososphaerales archaeon]